LGLYAFVFGIAAMAVVAGAVAGVRLVAQPSAHGEHVQSNLGRPIPTSFGWVSVNQVVRLGGPPAAELVRFRNGVEAIQVSVTLTNLDGRRLRLSADQFAVRVDVTRRSIAPGVWSLPYHPPTGMWAGKALLRYLVPRHAALSFVFRDPGRVRPISVPLGHAGAAPEASLNLDNHAVHGSYP
jgi:hypothetical protein